MAAGTKLCVLVIVTIIAITAIKATPDWRDFDADIDPNNMFTYESHDLIFVCGITRVSTVYGIYMEEGPFYNITISGVNADNCAGAYFEDPNAFDRWLGSPFMAIKLPCGCRATYQTIKEVPRETTGCEHGNFFIKIGAAASN